MLLNECLFSEESNIKTMWPSHYGISRASSRCSTYLITVLKKPTNGSVHPKNTCSYNEVKSYRKKCITVQFLQCYDEHMHLS